MIDTACLVACGSSKRNGKEPAWQLYDSTLFQKSWGAAMMLGQPYVISAKHGLLHADDRIEPYDETLKNKDDAEKRQWAEDIESELSNKYNTVIIFGGRDYVEPIKDVFGTYRDVDVLDPYNGTSGNGEQMSVGGDIIAAEVNDE